MADQNSNPLSKISMSMPVSMQKIASLPSLAAGLISPAAVAKTVTLPKVVGNSTVTSTIGQQIALLNNSGANTNILIKTTKTNSSGQPTYVAISIPTQTTTSSGSAGGPKVLPLAIHQLKINKQQHQGAAETTIEKDRNNVKIESINISTLCSTFSSLGEIYNRIGFICWKHIVIQFS